ncbi:GMC family oxidoreductase [Cumulibacter manganitolerans]|uniref:GMC family oxidoreductase n=1 Tax=Cumulibacter manganitolerans TaxID=1884992 RepID=UPI001885CB86|nr:GMC family oxidoreductase [Cumulibacter manganitolerans]
MQVDYLIVGAGAAGCALAARLGEDPTVQVLVLEAGGATRRPSTVVPRAFPFALESELLQSYPVRAAPGGEASYWVRGRGLGGSTALNGMMYLRGAPAAYDDLESGGNPGWGWAVLEEAFEELERRFVRPTRSTLNPLDELLLETVESRGMHRVDDLNAAGGPRSGATPATISGGRRMSAARALLEPARRRGNVRVLTGTSARSLLWKGTRVTGVRAERNGGMGELTGRTVILCAGTIETPLLLERSGVGDPARLRAAGIDVRVPSPNVGENVREQRGQALQIPLREPVGGASELRSLLALARQAARYAVDRGGALARPAYDVAAIAETTSGGAQLVAAPFGLDEGGRLRPARHPAVLLGGYRIKPSSTARIHVRAADPDGPALIELAPRSADDVAADDEIGRLLQDLAATDPLAGVADPARVSPAPTALSVYHAVGSAAMGPQAADVVDERLRVRGTEGLRVADLSILPFHTSGATAAPAMAIGWIAGGLLADDRR